MSGQMCWLAGLAATEEKILHLRLESHHPWKPYNSLSEYAVRDYSLPRGSKGMATFHRLIKAGWTVVPSDQAHQTQFSPSKIPAAKGVSS